MKRPNPNQLSFDFRPTVVATPRIPPRAPIAIPAPDPIVLPCVRPCWAVIWPLSRAVGHNIRCKRPVGHEGYCETKPQPWDTPTDPTAREIRQAYERNRTKKKRQERERQMYARTG